MKLVLSEGEKIYYNFDYCKGKCNITITDKRLISAVKEKNELTRNEFLVDDICSIKMRFRPTSIMAFIISGFYSIISHALYLFKERNEFDYLIKIFNVENKAISIVFTYIGTILFLFAIISFIVGLLSLRNGYYLILRVKVGCYIDVMSSRVKINKAQNVKLKPSKRDAYTLMDDIPVTLSLIKSASSKN